MKRQFSVIIERDARGWYVGTVPDLKGCYSQAKSLDTLMKRIRRAIEACLKDDDKSTQNEFLGVQRVEA
jgi:predicted RNase H-like HicB family nuclease